MKNNEFDIDYVALNLLKLQIGFNEKDVIYCRKNGKEITVFLYNDKKGFEGFCSMSDLPDIYRFTEPVLQILDSGIAGKCLYFEKILCKIEGESFEMLHDSISDIKIEKIIQWLDEGSLNELLKHVIEDCFYSVGTTAAVESDYYVSIELGDDEQYLVLKVDLSKFITKIKKIRYEKRTVEKS